jgi:hypothetical protein
MSDLNNKHLPSDIDSLTRKDLVELFHIQMAENQKLVKQVAELERERDELIIIANTAINISQRPHPYITDAKNRLEQLRKGAGDDN